MSTVNRKVRRIHVRSFFRMLKLMWRYKDNVKVHIPNVYPFTICYFYGVGYRIRSRNTYYLIENAEKLVGEFEGFIDYIVLFKSINVNLSSLYMRMYYPNGYNFAKVEPEGKLSELCKHLKIMLYAKEKSHKTTSYFDVWCENDFQMVLEKIFPDELIWLIYSYTLPEIKNNLVTVVSQ